MASDKKDAPKKAEQPAPAPTEKTEQQIFDEQIAHATARAVLIVGGIAILAALVMSTIALVNSTGSSSTKTVTVTQAAGTGTTGTTTGPAALTGGALGRQIFVSGDPSTGVIACGSCHTMKAAGTTATVGPNLDKELSSDPASATLESVVNPNKEIVPGYPANLMPKNYGTALTKPQLAALIKYVYDSTNVKAKQQAAAGAGSTTAGG
ncbi:MAG TPA: c-type cytochrome [Solirubrobacteraceae bacterium]|nr:c-type cytochrome [Solirubrobacteraceae bacterium]